MKADWTKSPKGATHFYRGRFYRVNGGFAEFYFVGDWITHSEDARLLVIRPECEKAPV